ncbi:MAG TPA: hypothetical protein ENJ82_13160 [Bacteroidetes bacterium]|nr:hypothetical protein [Bacteroidota bacterium]
MKIRVKKRFSFRRQANDWLGARTQKSEEVNVPDSAIKRVAEVQREMDERFLSKERLDLYRNLEVIID